MRRLREGGSAGAVPIWAESSKGSISGDGEGWWPHRTVKNNQNRRPKSSLPRLGSSRWQPNRLTPPGRVEHAEQAPVRVDPYLACLIADPHIVTSRRDRAVADADLGGLLTLEARDGARSPGRDHRRDSATPCTKYPDEDEVVVRDADLEDRARAPRGQFLPPFALVGDEMQSHPVDRPRSFDEAGSRAPELIAQRAMLGVEPETDLEVVSPVARGLDIRDGVEVPSGLPHPKALDGDSPTCFAQGEPSRVYLLGGQLRRPDSPPHDSKGRRT